MVLGFDQKEAVVGVGRMDLVAVGVGTEVETGIAVVLGLGAVEEQGARFDELGKGPVRAVHLVEGNYSQ